VAGCIPKTEEDATEEAESWEIFPGGLGRTEVVKLPLMAERKGRVLVVDDDEAVRRLLGRAASKAGVAILVSSNGRGVVDFAVSEGPDLILLDMRMPSADGRDILSSLKRDERTAGIPVFIYSGNYTEDDRRVAFDLGADDFFEKGYDLVLLFRRIVDTIEKARSGVYETKRRVDKAGEGQ
jgi:DNA-binding response OmpR family regulator